MNAVPLIVFTEATSGKGEDGKPVFVTGQTVAIGVFDGLGGRSAGYDGMTGGRIASSLASQITRSFLQQKSANFSEQDVKQLQNNICKVLKAKADSKIKSRLKGKLAENRLCTTLALVSISNPNLQDNPFQLNLAWIGDSRIYFLSRQGLQQLTKDDLTVQNDAFKLIREDPPMSKYITADMPSDWQINFKVAEFTEAGCVIACTDGCFQYLNSPWAFERLILETLANSKSVATWENLLLEAYEKIKQDDVSFVLYPVGFDSFCTLKSCYQERLNKIYNDFHSETDSYNELKKLWDTYRLDYEKRLTSADMENHVDNLNQGTNEDLLLEGQKSEKLINDNDIPAIVTLACGSLDNSEEIKVLLEKASGYLAAKNWLQAIKVCLKVIDLEPDNIKAKFSIGRAYSRLGESEEKLFPWTQNHRRYYFQAENWLESAFNIADVKDTTTEQKAIFAFVLEKVGKYDRAIEVCYEIIQNNPNSAYAFHLIAYIQKRQGLVSYALKNINMAIKLYKRQGDFVQASQLQLYCDEVSRECNPSS